MADFTIGVADSEIIFNHYLKLYGKKNELPALISYADKAYEAYPDNWQFVYLKSVLKLQVTRDYQAAIAIVKKYTKKIESDCKCPEHEEKKNEIKDCC